MSSPNPSCMAALHMLSANVNGLGDHAKRITLFNSLAHAQWNVVALQETHTPDEATAESYLAQGSGAGMPFMGKAYWSHGTSASRGVAILLGPHTPLQHVTVGYRDALGRLLRLDATYMGTCPLRLCPKRP
jgi:exonuclease III